VYRLCLDWRPSRDYVPLSLTIGTGSFFFRNQADGSNSLWRNRSLWIGLRSVLSLTCVDPRPHAWSMCASCFCPCISLSNIGVPQYIGVPHQVNYPYYRLAIGTWSLSFRIDANGSNSPREHSLTAPIPYLRIVNGINYHSIFFDRTGNGNLRTTTSQKCAAVPRRARI